WKLLGQLAQIRGRFAASQVVESFWLPLSFHHPYRQTVDSFPVRRGELDFGRPTLAELKIAIQFFHHPRQSAENDPRLNRVDVRVLSPLGNPLTDRPKRCSADRGAQLGQIAANPVVVLA